MGAMTLDTIMIKIESDASAATGNIDKLSESLSKLKTSVKGGFNHLKVLGTSLEKLEEVSHKIPTITKNLNNMSGFSTAMNTFADIANPKGLAKVVTNLEKLPKVMANITPKNLENISRVSRQVADALTPLAEKLGQIGQGLHAISELADKYGVSVTKVNSYQKQAAKGGIEWGNILKNTLSKGMKLFGSTAVNTSKTVVRFLGKTNSKLKQIGLSLLGTRTLFTAVRKAVSEYMAMDQELTKSITNSWRAFGAQLAPAVEYVIHLFTQLVRVIYSIIKALTGIDLIARANAKAMASWAASSKDTLGNLQKFDDLNVAEFGKDSGDNKLIELDEIDLSPIQKVIDWVKKLKQAIKDAWNSGQWYGVGEVLAEGLNAALNAIETQGLMQKIASVASKFGDLLQGFIDNTEWKTFGTKLTEVLKIIPDAITQFINEIPWEDVATSLEDFLSTFKFGEVVKSLSNMFTTAAVNFLDVLSKQDWEVIGTQLYEVLAVVFSDFNKILNAIPWEGIGTAIRTVLSKIEWGKVIEKALATLFSTLAEILAGLTGSTKEEAAPWTLPFLAALMVLPPLIALIPKLVTGLGSIGNATKALANTTGTVKKVVDIAAIAVALGGIILVLKEVTKLIKAFAETGMSATAGIMLIVTVFGSLALATMVIGRAFNAMDWTSIAGAVVILGGLALVISQLASIFGVFCASGLSVGEALGFLGGTLGIVVAAMAIMLKLSTALSSNPLALVGLLALVAAISAVLLVVKETLPTILDACGKFIETIAPPIIDILNTMYDGIEKIIRALGDVLPPIIESLGGIFDHIFGGISNVVRTVGQVVIMILDSIGKLIENVFNSIIGFIEKLGPAINTFVDNIITAVTKMVNFVVSAIEFMINGIISAINGLSSGLRKIGNKLFDLIGVDVQFDPISKVYLDRFVPKLSTGTNDVPYEGLYHLHPGEAVVPKKYNPALGNGGSEETNQKLDTLIYLMENMNFTNIVNVGNDTLYKGQQAYNKMQNDKYGTTVNI